ARYAGEGATDEENINKLLSLMNGIENRNARFICSIVYFVKSGDMNFFDGECEGVILNKPMGELGFGYDPVFYLKDYRKTMAEIHPDIKNKISHRAKALSKLISNIG
ncbi:MAG: non-canonical purine NTP pyrophosphatase, partial [Thermodesulfobacteriota bacterium]